MASRRALLPFLLRQVPSRSGATALRPLHASSAILQTAVVTIARTANPIGVRRYSQAAGSKIWSFEEIQALTQETDSKIVLVDSREPSELKSSGRIPTAINIPVTSAPDSFHITEDEFEDRYGFSRPDKDTEVVFYCKAGVRSRAAAGLAREAGWKNVGEYPGSYLDWEGNGGKIER